MGDEVVDIAGGVGLISAKRSSQRGWNEFLRFVFFVLGLLDVFDTGVIIIQ